MIGEYLLDAEEMDKLMGALVKVSQKDFKFVFGNIIKAEEQENVIRDFLCSHFEEITSAREVFALPSGETILESLIYTTSVNESTIDEAPMAYKSLEDIIDVIRESVDIIGRKAFDNVVLGFFSKRLSVFKVPRFGVKAVFTVVGTARNEQRNSYALAVCDVVILYFTVIHQRWSTLSLIS